MVKRNNLELRGGGYLILIFLISSQISCNKFTNTNHESKIENLSQDLKCLCSFKIDMDETNTTEFVSNNKFDDLEPQFKPLFTPISKRTVVDYCSDVNGNIRMHIDYSLPPRYENTMPSQVPPDLDNELKKVTIVNKSMSFLYASGRIENHPNQENMIHNLIGYFLETHNKLKNKNFEELLTEVKKNNIQVKKVDDDIYEFNQPLNVKNKTTIYSSKLNKILGTVIREKNGKISQEEWFFYSDSTLKYKEVNEYIEANNNIQLNRKKIIEFRNFDIVGDVLLIGKNKIIKN